MNSEVCSKFNAHKFKVLTIVLLPNNKEMSTLHRASNQQQVSNRLTLSILLHTPCQCPSMEETEDAASNTDSMQRAQIKWISKVGTSGGLRPLHGQHFQAGEQILHHRTSGQESKARQKKAEREGASWTRSGSERAASHRDFLLPLLSTVARVGFRRRRARAAASP